MIIEAMIRARNAMVSFQDGTNGLYAGEFDEEIKDLNVAIEQAQKQERPHPDSICQEDDGCPTEIAVLQRFWRENQQAQKQEPVGEVEQIEIDDDGQASAWFKLHDHVELGDLLYTSPPQRQPLTDEQKLNLVTNWFAEDWAIKQAIGLLHDYEAAHGIKGEA